MQEILPFWTAKGMSEIFIWKFKVWRFFWNVNGKDYNVFCTQILQFILQLGKTCPLLLPPFPCYLVTCSQCFLANLAVLWTFYELQIKGPLFGTLEYFTSQKSDVGNWCIFIKTSYYDILQTNGTLNMDHHDIIYALPKGLPYFSHLTFVIFWKLVFLYL